MGTSTLTLDRGNSTLDVMLHGPEPRRRRLPVDDIAGLEAMLGAHAVAACVGVSVVPGGLDQVEVALRQRGLALRMVGRDLPCPVPLAYDTPATLGADRWLGAFAAHRAFGAAIVVDCGSATTVNLITADGVFRGGAIAPGLQAMVEGMRRVTPHLPPADPAQSAPLPSRSSVTAVCTGVALAFCGAIDRLVADTRRAAGESVTVVLTGGQAGLYLRHGGEAVQHQPDLVHTGLLALVAAPVSGPRCDS